MTNRKTKVKRRALLSGLCAMSVGLLLWGATLGAMALTPNGAAQDGDVPLTVYAPTGLISPTRDEQGQNLPKLVPAQPSEGRHY